MLELAPLISVIAFVSSLLLTKHPKPWLATTATIIAIGLGLVIGANLIPGFTHLEVFGPIQLSENSREFSLQLKTNKLLLAMVLLVAFSVWLKPPVQKLTTKAKQWAMLLVVLTPVVTLSLGVLLDVVQWQPKWHHSIWAFLAINLLVTCVAEEYFFRGLIHEPLRKRFRSSHQWIPIVVTAILFGAVHAPAGWVFATVAGVSAIFHGMIYHLTRRISLCVLNHWLLNMSHFIWLTYPAVNV